MNILEKSLLVAAVGGLLFVGCSQPQNPTASSSPTASVPTPVVTPQVAGPSLQVKLPDGRDLSFTPSKGFFDPRGDIKEGTISVANYEFQMQPMAANSVEAITQDGQIRVAFGLKSLPDGDYAKPITPGQYSAANISFVEVYSFENGSQVHSGFDNEQGTVTVSEVSDSEISGSIDVTADNGAFLKGTFSAQTTRKSS